MLFDCLDRNYTSAAGVVARSGPRLLRARIFREDENCLIDLFYVTCRQIMENYSGKLKTRLRALRRGPSRLTWQSDQIYEKYFPM